MIIRPLEPYDIPAVLDIYRPYVLETTVTFEYDVPLLAEFTTRVKQITTDLPWLVCVQDNEILGYAYASHYHERTAFQWDCELSIYIHKNACGKGYGKRLYQELLTILTDLGYYNAYAVICYPNEQSVGLHQKLGFVNGGIHHNVGFKFGKWCDLIYLYKPLRPFDSPTEAPKRFLHSKN